MNVKKILVCIIIIIILSVGVILGSVLFSKKESNIVITDEKNKDEIEIKTVEINSNEEKTTPNTLIIYKTYYAKCNHYITEYEEIDASLVNLNEDEFKEKLKKWNVENFSAKEIEVSKEVNENCNEHYVIKLVNDVIVIYLIDENGKEREYDITTITKEYLTEEDILKLTSGISIYGRNNLTSTIEDYE